MLLFAVRNKSHLIFLFEAVALSSLHLVDVLQKVSHSDSRVELPCVVGGAFAPTLMPRGASQQAAGLVHQTTSVTYTETDGFSDGHIFH